jgi:hypothetical protein
MWFRGADQIGSVIARMLELGSSETEMGGDEDDSQ